MDFARLSPLESIAGGAAVGALLVVLAMRAGDPGRRGLTPFVAMSVAAAVYFFGLAGYIGAAAAAHAAVALRVQVLGALGCSAAFVWCMAAARNEAPAIPVQAGLLAGGLVLGVADVLSPASLRLAWETPEPGAWTVDRGFTARPGAWTTAFHAYNVAALFAGAPYVVRLARARAPVLAAGTVAALLVVVVANAAGVMADHGLVPRHGGFILPALVLVLGATGYMLGVTQRRARAELEVAGEGLREANESLRREMEMRTRLERRLAETQKMEALGRMAAGVAHDFNNVLTAITGQAELLDARPAQGPAEREALVAIHCAGARGAAMTRQLLAFTRGRGADPVRIDPASVLAEMAPMLHRLVGASVTLELPAAPGPAEIVADRAMFEQVILNLVVNARDACNDGGTIRVALARIAPGGTCPSCALSAVDAHVALTVADDGSGMDEATRARIFEPFFTTKPGDQGTGLGLAIVYSAVRQAGGQIGVTSAPGRGSEFRICWPCTNGVQQEVVVNSPEAVTDSAPV